MRDLPTCWTNWSACCWTWPTAPRRSPRRSSKRSRKRSRGVGFCSKFVWSTRNSNNGRRPGSLRRRTTNLPKERGTKYDLRQFSRKEKHCLDRNCCAAAGAGRHTRARTQGNSRAICGSSAGPAGGPGQRTGTARTRARSKRERRRKTRAGTGSARAGAGQNRTAAGIVRRRPRRLGRGSLRPGCGEIPATGGDERSADRCSALLEGVRGEPPGQEGHGTGHHRGPEAALSAEPLAKRCRRAGDRGETVDRPTCKAGGPERRRIENAGDPRIDEQRLRTRVAPARESDQRFGLPERKIEGALCVGTKRVAAGTRNSWQYRARTEQSGIAAEGGRISGTLRGCRSAERTSRCAAKRSGSSGWFTERASWSSCIRLKLRRTSGAKSCRPFFLRATRGDSCRPRKEKKMRNCGGRRFETLG